MDLKETGGVRSFVINAVTEQFKAGDSSINVDPIVAAVLADETMTHLAVVYVSKASYSEAY